MFTLNPQSLKHQGDYEPYLFRIYIHSIKTNGSYNNKSLTLNDMERGQMDRILESISRKEN